MVGPFYDPVAHVYSWDGVPWLSVTQVLHKAGRIDDRWYTPDAAERGRRVHAFTVKLDQIEGRIPNTPPVNAAYTIPDDIGAEVDAYRQFVADCRPVYNTIEQAIFAPWLRVGGRPDRTLLTLLGHAGGVLELKTGQAQDWHEEQTAGYVELDPARGGPRWVCYLGKNGRYKLKQCRSPLARRRFLLDVPKAYAAVSHATV